MILLSLSLCTLNDNAKGTTTTSTHMDQDNFDCYYAVSDDYLHGIFIDAIKYYDVTNIVSIIQPFVIVDPNSPMQNELVYFDEDYSSGADHDDWGTGGFEIFATYDLPLTYYEDNLVITLRIGFDGQTETNGQILCQATIDGDSPNTDYDVYWRFDLKLQDDYADEYFEECSVHDWDEIGNEDNARCENKNVKVHDNSNEDFNIEYGASTSGDIWHYQCLLYKEGETMQEPSVYKDGDDIDTKDLVLWFAGRTTTSHNMLLGLDLNIETQC